VLAGHESHLDAAQRALAFAKEQNIVVHELSVSTMRQPEDKSRGGLVYVVNDTRLYEVRDGRVVNAGRLAKP
jgi:hypothetical protein